MRRRAAVRRAARDLVGAVDRGALPRRGLPRRWACWKSAFESYLEDVDFGLRCAAHGVRGRYVPQARATASGQRERSAAGTPETVRRIARNQLLLAARHYPGAADAWPVVDRGSFCGAEWRCGTVRAWRGCAASGAGSSPFLRRATGISARAIPNVLEQILHANEQFHSHGTVRIRTGSCTFSLTGVGQSDT